MLPVLYKKHTQMISNSIQIVNTHTTLSHFQWLMHHIPSLCTPLSPLGKKPVEKPVNLLFSLDQFVFEFSKKGHNQKKHGEFFHQLKERKKLSLFYGGISRKDIATLIHHAKKTQGAVSKNMVFVLERRLDVVLQRSGFCRTLQQARHWIAHKKVLVNGEGVTSPGYALRPGENVSFVPSFSHSLSTLTKPTQVIPHNPTKRWQVSKKTCDEFFQWISTQIQTRPPLDSKNQSLTFWRKGLNKNKSPQSLQTTQRHKSSGGKAWCGLLSKSVGCSQKGGRFLSLTQQASCTLFVTSRPGALGHVTPMKPLHLEISYKLARVIYLYAPQRLEFPFLLNLDLIRRSVC